MRTVNTTIREKFLSLAAATGKSVLSLNEIKDICSENDMSLPQWFMKDSNNRAGTV